MKTFWCIHEDLWKIISKNKFQKEVALSDFLTVHEKCLPKCLFSVKLFTKSNYQSVCFQWNCPWKVSANVFGFGETIHEKHLTKRLLSVKLSMKSAYQNVYFQLNSPWKVSTKVFVSSKLSTKSFYQCVYFQCNCRQPFISSNVKTTFFLWFWQILIVFFESIN